MTKNKKIGALWGRTFETDEGETKKYLSGILDLGVFGEIPVVIFPNRKKNESKHPDMLVFVSSPKGNGEVVEEEVEPEPETEEERDLLDDIF